MAQHRYHAELRRRLTHAVYAAFIDADPHNPPAIKNLHLHTTHADIVILAQTAADGILGDPSIGLTMRRAHD